MSADNFSDTLTAAERDGIVPLGHSAHALILQHPGYTMSLGDLIDELRGIDIRSAMIDEVIIFLSSARMVEIWRHRVTNETWITAIV